MFRLVRGSSIIYLPLLILWIAGFSGCVGLAPGTTPGGTPEEVIVNTSGGGMGTITSTPSGINCSALGAGTNSGTCQATFNGSTTLTAAPNQGFTFSGWSGCTTSNSTTCSVSSASTVTATFTASLQSINHIIFLAQENRSFDEYFGALREYWAQNGIPDQPFDGLPQFNPAGDPNAGPPPTNPGCDPTLPYPPNSWCSFNQNSPPVQSFHYGSTCVENPSPSWGEAHRQWNAGDPTSATPAMNGFVEAAANDGRQHVNNEGQFAPYFDVDGIRAMGYYDGNDLNYYYALASAFSTSDRWFAPVMTRTPPNREYLIAGTSHGYIYQRGGNPPADSPLIPSTTIFEVLQKAGISWKIYINPKGTPCTETDIACLTGRSYIHDFVFGHNIILNPSAYTEHIAPISQFYTDAINGTLPQVAQIEPASSAALDEHPEDDDPPPGQPACCSMQAGANNVSTLINAVMCGENAPPSGSCTPGASWNDSVFILTFDEPGGFYDHVPPQPTVNPDGIAPVDLFPNDPCFGATTPGTICDFSYTGFRIPLVVVSPYARKNFVSHQVRDTTAILKLIETRFNLSALTKRDAAQVPMDDQQTGFFDFDNVPWRTPPSNLPAQIRLPGSACFVNPPPTSP
ncbi:MAG TPA: alkaline phosphatase family protein [Terriglobales bacterium]|nr:alkaline phosphatase family protein [Terriglobales bacterium]